MMVCCIYLGCSLYSASMLCYALLCVRVSQVHYLLRMLACMLCYPVCLRRVSMSIRICYASWPIAFCVCVPVHMHTCSYRVASFSPLSPSALVVFLPSFLVVSYLIRTQPPQGRKYGCSLASSPPHPSLALSEKQSFEISMPKGCASSGDAAGVLRKPWGIMGTCTACTLLL